MLTRRGALRLLGAGGLALGGAGCSGPGAAGTEFKPVRTLYPVDGPPAVGDALVSGSIAEATTFVSFLSSDAASHGYAGQISNGLIRYNPRLELEPALAERWEVSPDGLTITFHLRRGVKWHDGHPFTAEDVHFAWKTITDPDTPTPYADDYLKVKQAQVLDPYTFRVRYDEPFAPALESWGLAPLPVHRLRGQKIQEASFGTKDPIGTGPYMLRRPEDWRYGEQITFTRNPNYWEGTVWLQNQVIRIIPDPSTQFLELKTGGLDAMGLTPTQFKFQTGTTEFREHFDKYAFYGNGYTYLAFNLKDPRFADKRVRQAFAHAIDKEELIKGVLLGYGVPITAPTSPAHWVYNPNVKTYDYNPQKALDLLKAAGWTRDANGRLAKDGRPFAFELITNNGNQQRARTAEIVQRRLDALGIQVKIRTIEWAAFIKDFVNAGKFEAMILGWNLAQDPDQWPIWHSSQAEPGKLNHVYYKNAEVDRLLDAGRATFDREKRKLIYWRFQEIMAEEQPYVFLYQGQGLSALHKRFKGVQPTPTGIDYLSEIRWFVPQPYQKHVLTT
jgi:peptide/nickel transport system substrate-binding protein